MRIDPSAVRLLSAKNDRGRPCCEIGPLMPLSLTVFATAEDGRVKAAPVVPTARAVSVAAEMKCLMIVPAHRSCTEEQAHSGGHTFSLRKWRVDASRRGVDLCRLRRHRSTGPGRVGFKVPKLLI